ncbi:MAG: hypothetical protein M1838_002772 [Thelocarpon superellum]|nr:MAG: hypothetical protein M1838_002772 [Thelocarpon superellum]
MRARWMTKSETWQQWLRLPNASHVFSSSLLAIQNRLCSLLTAHAPRVPSAGISMLYLTLVGPVERQPTAMWLRRNRISSYAKAATPATAVPKRTIACASSRNLGGVTVIFGAGAEVSSITLPADMTAVRITGLPGATTSARVLEILEPLGLEVETASIRIKAILDNVGAFEVRVHDPRFATKAVQLLDTTLVNGSPIKVCSTQVVQDHDSKRLQVASVVCSWHKPSKVAWANFSQESQARRSEQFAQGKMLHGRKLECTFQAPSNARLARHRIYSVQVGNVAPQSREEHVSCLFPLAQRISVSPLSRDAMTMGDQVRARLEEAGPLESFDVSTKASPRYSKATAKFADPRDARAAVRDFHGKPLEKGGRAKLFLQPLVSVKFRVLAHMYEAIRTELEDVMIQVASTHVHLKAYDSQEPEQPFKMLRVCGEDARAVALAKSAVEDVLAGTVALVGERVLWHDFFTTPDGLQFLAPLRSPQHAFVYRDLRKRRLSLYGSEELKRQTRRVLVQKVEDLGAHVHVIDLEPPLLHNALQGGFRTILKVLGSQAACLDIGGARKTLTIRGDAAHRRIALDLLERAGGRTDEAAIDARGDDQSCAVCWTTPTDPFHPPCGHVYCDECFSAQCASSGGSASVPVQCLGDEGRCGHSFSLDQLEGVLSAQALDALLQASFEDYVRTKPAELQYCPTPDCPQIYRVSTDGLVFTCPSCLTPVCTTCQVASHDGSTCQEYKDLSSEGTLAFQKWMKENEVKACPKCNTPIEKRSGCNHMTCRGCQTHFCWVCVRPFDKGAIYDHMTREHGDIGLEQELNDAVDDAEDRRRVPRFN